MNVDIRQLNLKTQIEGFLKFAREKGSNEPAQMALELALSKLTENEKEAFFSDLIDSYLSYAEDWVLNLCEESEEDSTDEKRCFITDDYNEIYLPISKEDFLDSLNLSIYVSYDKDESDILVDGYINCEPDYFAGHSIEFIVDSKGNFEIEGLAG